MLVSSTIRTLREAVCNTKKSYPLTYPSETQTSKVFIKGHVCMRHSYIIHTWFQSTPTPTSTHDLLFSRSFLL